MMGSPEPYRRCHGRRGTSFRFPFALLLLISLVFSSAAQPPSSGSSGAYPSTYGRFNPSMAIIIIVLICAFFFMGFFSIYLRQCGERADPSIRPAGFGARSRRAAARGLDPEVIRTFPALNYSDIKEHKIGKGALECAVCLSEFEDDDTLRLLPKCDHVFHPDCIDAWLSAHTTCPVCRANLVPQPGERVPAPIPVVSAAAAAAAAEADSAAATGDDGAGGGELQRESDNSSSPVRQQPDHVSIIVDDLTAPEPRKEESSTAPSAAEKVTRFSTKGLIPWRSKSSIRPPRFPRSHSTGHSLTVVQPGEDCERYTLRLPEHIRRDIMTGKLQRSSSCAAFPNAGEGSSTRKGVYGGEEGSSRGGAGGSVGGRSLKLRKWEWVAKSDRWAFFTRTFSMRTPRGDAAAEGSTTRRGVTGGEGSVRRGADGGDEGSVKAKAFPTGCLGGGEDVTAASPKAAGSTTSRV